MKRVRLLCATLCIGLGWSSWVLAQDLESVTEQTTATADTQTVIETPQQLSYFITSYLTGPPVANPTSNETAAYIAGNTLGLSLENQIGLRWQLTDKFFVSPVYDFEYQFTDPHRGGIEKRVAMIYDSYIRAYLSNVYSHEFGDNVFSVDLEARYYVPTSEFSRINDSLGSVRFGFNPGVEVLRTGVSISAVNFVRYWIETRNYEAGSGNTALSLANASHALPMWTLYTGPQISYRVTDKISTWLLFETSMTIDTLGVSNVNNIRASLADFEPGVDFHITDSLTISPFLNWYTRQPLKSTSINLTANLTI